MRRPDPKEYDFLWKVDGVDFLFTSVWLHEDYLGHDFIVCNEGGMHRLFIGKADRERLSEEGLRLLREGYEEYTTRTEQAMREAQAAFAERPQTQEMTNDELAAAFSDAVSHVQRLWKNYFWTEYFCHDLVPAAMQADERLRATANRMAAFKYEQRKLLNTTFFGDATLKAFSRGISRRFGIDADNYHYRELLRLLNGERVALPDRSCYVLGKFNGWHEIDGQEAKAILESLVPKPSVELHGLCANPGLYRGRARVIPFGSGTNLAAEIAKMRQGDVLVTATTGPEMLLACQKAGAIVTDEGGIMSHAALVSRELRIPCVVGTKVASDSLKDGDLVEVDATNGTVRKIERTF